MTSLSTYTRGAGHNPKNKGDEDTSNDSNEKPLPLPNEIWTMILKRVERNRDLLSCRQMNQLWYSMATPICRRHFVFLNFCKVLKRLRVDTEAFFSTFKDCKNLPWSACELNILDSLFCLGQQRSFLEAQTSKFIRLFGEDIHELRISGDSYNRVIRTLDGVPNITYLDLSSMGSTRIKIHESLSAHLGRLNGLVVTIGTSASFHFFQLLLSRPEVQLRSIKLQIVPGNWLNGNAEVVSTLIAGIPIIHLRVTKFFRPLFIELNRKGVKVHQLTIHVDAPPRNPVFYVPCEAFLENTADSLQKLSLDYSPRRDRPRSRSKGNTRLTIPKLPKLTCLTVIDAACYEVADYEDQLRTLTPFTSDQFPMLAKVDLLYCSRSIRLVSLFELGHFDTVTELHLEDFDGQCQDSLETEWDRSFPNLKRLSVTKSIRRLGPILSKCKKVEQLFLFLTGPQRHYQDLTRILSGGRQFVDEVPLGDEFGPQQDEPEATSLRSLLRLKTFELILQSQWAMCDASVDSYLLQIQPLHKLYLENVAVSDECKDKLQRYHRKAEIHAGINYNHKRFKKPSKFHEMR